MPVTRTENAFHQSDTQRYAHGTTIGPKGNEPVDANLAGLDLCPCERNVRQSIRHSASAVNGPVVSTKSQQEPGQGALARTG